MKWSTVSTCQATACRCEPPVRVNSCVHFQCQVPSITHGVPFIVRVVPNNCVLLNSRDKTPYLVFLEVVEPSDLAAAQQVPCCDLRVSAHGCMFRLLCTVRVVLHPQCFCQRRHLQTELEMLRDMQPMPRYKKPSNMNLRVSERGWRRVHFLDLQRELCMVVRCFPHTLFCYLSILIVYLRLQDYQPHLSTPPLSPRATVGTRLVAAPPLSSVIICRLQL